MKNLSYIFLTLFVSMFSFASDYIQEQKLQKRLSSHILVKNMIQEMDGVNCSEPFQLINTKEICSVIDSKCTFAFTFICKVNLYNDGYHFDRQISGVASYDASSKQLKISQIMVDVFPNHKDWISELKHHSTTTESNYRHTSDR